jgi:hypothetical protein
MVFSNPSLLKRKAVALHMDAPVGQPGSAALSMHVAVTLRVGLDSMLSRFSQIVHCSAWFVNIFIQNYGDSVVVQLSFK